MGSTCSWICVNCGLQYPEADRPPSSCLVCADDRESISHKPQRWTRLTEMYGVFTNVFTPLGDNVTGIRTSPSFGIGQEAFLVETTHGHILWDCLAYVDDATVRDITARGGLTAIMVSHPHFFGSMVQWSHALGNVPVYVHRENKAWISRPDGVIQLWDGDRLELNSSVTMIRSGGHFPGSCVLHWKDGADGKGFLFTSDTILPVEDRRWVSFMYSYPNLIPISRRSVEKLVASVANLPFDRIYGGPMYGSGGERPIIPSGAKATLLRSAQRYIDHLDS